MSSDTFISLKMADKTLYPLYKTNEWGRKSVILSAAVENQEKIELRFYSQNPEDKQDLLFETAIEKTDMLEDQWCDIQLITELDSSLGLSVTLSAGENELLHKQVSLPAEERYLPEEEPQERLALSSAKPLLSLVLAGILVFSSLAGAWFLADRLSSAAPPQLDNSPVLSADYL